MSWKDGREQHDNNLTWQQQCQRQTTGLPSQMPIYTAPSVPPTYPSNTYQNPTQAGPPTVNDADLYSNRIATDPLNRINQYGISSPQSNRQPSNPASIRPCVVNYLGYQQTSNINANTGQNVGQRINQTWSQQPGVLGTGHDQTMRTVNQGQSSVAHTNNAYNLSSCENLTKVMKILNSPQHHVPQIHPASPRVYGNVCQAATIRQGVGAHVNMQQNKRVGGHQSQSIPQQPNHPRYSDVYGNPNRSQTIQNSACTDQASYNTSPFAHGQTGFIPMRQTSRTQITNNTQHDLPPFAQVQNQSRLASFQNATPTFQGVPSNQAIQNRQYASAQSILNTPSGSCMPHPAHQQPSSIAQYHTQQISSSSQHQASLLTQTQMTRQSNPAACKVRMMLPKPNTQVPSQNLPMHTTRINPSENIVDTHGDRAAMGNLYQAGITQQSLNGRNERSHLEQMLLNQATTQSSSQGHDTRPRQNETMATMNSKVGIENLPLVKPSKSSNPFVLKPTICTDEVIEYKVADLLRFLPKFLRNRHKNSESEGHKQSEKSTTPSSHSTDNSRTAAEKQSAANTTNQVEPKNVPRPSNFSNRSDDNVAQEPISASNELLSMPVDFDQAFLSDPSAALDVHKRCVLEELTFPSEFRSEHIDNDLGMMSGLRTSPISPPAPRTSPISPSDSSLQFINRLIEIQVQKDNGVNVETEPVNDNATIPMIVEQIRPPESPAADQQIDKPVPINDIPSEPNIPSFNQDPLTNLNTTTEPCDTDTVILPKVVEGSVRTVEKDMRSSMERSLLPESQKRNTLDTVDEELPKKRAKCKPTVRGVGRGRGRECGRGRGRVRVLGKTAVSHSADEITLSPPSKEHRGRGRGFKRSGTLRCQRKSGGSNRQMDQATASTSTGVGGDLQGRLVSTPEDLKVLLDSFNQEELTKYSIDLLSLKNFMESIKTQSSAQDNADKSNPVPAVTKVEPSDDDNIAIEVKDKTVESPNEDKDEHVPSIGKSKKSEVNDSRSDKMNKTVVNPSDKKVEIEIENDKLDIPCENNEEQPPVPKMESPHKLPGVKKYKNKLSRQNKEKSDTDTLDLIKVQKEQTHTVEANFENTDKSNVMTEECSLENMANERDVKESDENNTVEEVNVGNENLGTKQNRVKSIKQSTKETKEFAKRAGNGDEDSVGNDNKYSKNNHEENQSSSKSAVDNEEVSDVKSETKDMARESLIKGDSDQGLEFEMSDNDDDKKCVKSFNRPQRTGKTCEPKIIKPGYEINWVRFHGRVAIKIKTPTGKYFIMTEILRRCFRITEEGKKERVQYIRNEKINVLKIPELELPRVFFRTVIKNLKCRKVIKSEPTSLSIIEEENALRLFHHINGDKYCGFGCITVWIKPDKGGSRKRVRQSNNIETKKKAEHLNICEVIDLCSDDNETGYLSDTTVPYVDGTPTERIQELHNQCKSLDNDNKSSDLETMSSDLSSKVTSYRNAFDNVFKHLPVALACFNPKSSAYYSNNVPNSTSGLNENETSEVIPKESADVVLELKDSEKSNTTNCLSKTSVENIDCAILTEQGIKLDTANQHKDSGLAATENDIEDQLERKIPEIVGRSNDNGNPKHDQTNQTNVEIVEHDGVDESDKDEQSNNSKSTETFVRETNLNEGKEAQENMKIDVQRGNNSGKVNSLEDFVEVKSTRTDIELNGIRKVQTINESDSAVEVDSEVDKSDERVTVVVDMNKNSINNETDSKIEVDIVEVTDENREKRYCEIMAVNEKDQVRDMEKRNDVIEVTESALNLNDNTDDVIELSDSEQEFFQEFPLKKVKGKWVLPDNACELIEKARSNLDELIRRANATKEPELQAIEAEVYNKISRPLKKWREVLLRDCEDDLDMEKLRSVQSLQSNVIVVGDTNEMEVV